MDPYALVKSSQTTVRSFVPSFASQISFVMTLVCSMQPENPGTPLFLTEVSGLSGKMSAVLQGWQRIFPLDVELNRAVTGLCSFGVNIPSASCHESGTPPFCQTTFRSLHNRLRISGHILYGMALGPGAEAVRVFLMTSFTSLNVGSETSSCFSGAFTGFIRS